ncbi:MAG: biopolymer transporter ExbD [Candidatus Theseobacter exili]|nr:biopolymer transporter ExbD [Candidatus Theseobacter exili]
MASFKIKRKNEEPVIDVGTFSDIAFLLIIFFILTTTFIKPAGNKMEIPAGSTDTSQKTEKQMTVNLNGGKILWGENQKNMKIEEFRDYLLGLNLKEREEKNRVIIVDSSADVSYELYYQVVMAITYADGVMALIEHADKKKL